jgi:hypothetical protein
MTGNCPPRYFMVTYWLPQGIAPPIPGGFRGNHNGAGNIVKSKCTIFLVVSPKTLELLSGSARSSLVFHWLDVESENLPPPPPKEA